MSIHVEQSWTRIEDWLQLHAPGSHAGLRPPATPEAIDAAEQALGIAFPADLTASLLRHDGTGTSPEAQDELILPVDNALIPLQAMVSRWSMLTTILEEATDDPDALGQWFHPAWIPFAESGGADALVIDARPGAGYGRIGTFFHDDRTYFESYGSYAELLEATAEGLENNSAVDGVFPDVDHDGRLSWSASRGQ